MISMVPVRLPSKTIPELVLPHVKGLGRALSFPVATILLISLIEIIVGPSWVFTPEGFDQWFYHGYFINLKHHVAAFDGYYYGTRLAWILPGALAHSLFSPLVANAVLRLFVCWIAALSAYFLIRREYGTRCALVTALLLCSYPDFLSAAGWDYVDGAGIAYMLLCLEELGAAAFSFRDARGSSIRRAVFGGIAFAAAVHCNIFVLSLAPVVAFLFLVRTGIKGISMAVPVVIGFGAMTAGLGLISLGLGGHFLFFAPSISSAVTLARAPNPYYASPSIWIGHAWWLVIPCAIGLISIAFILRLLSNPRSGGWQKEAAIRLADIGAVPLVLAVFALLHASGILVLQAFYYASYLTIFVPVTAGAFIGRRLDSWRTSGFLVLATMCGLLALLVGTEVSRLLPTSIAVTYAAVRAKPDASATSLALALAAAILVAEFIRQRTASLLIVGASVGFVLIHLGSLQLRESTGAAASRELYLAVDRMSRELAQLSKDRPLWFWYSYSTGNEYYTSVASTYMWATRLLNRTLPDTAGLRYEALARGNYVAIMDNRQAVHDQAIATLQRSGVTVVPVKRVVATIGSTPSLVTLVQVTRRELPPKVYTESPARESLIPSSQLMDLDAEGLITHTSRALHGPRRPAESLPPWAIRITDTRDHAATNFQPIGEADQIAAIEVNIVDERPEGPYGPVNMILQDQDYRTLYETGTLREGTRSTLVALPGTARAIRIVFLANDDGYIRIAEHVTLNGFKRK
ncbi:MAG: hypothetical protein LAP61_00190 [Acidobacteriia bacterium]|nr:hypothetical protein [Terriglobia bacterium]